ncbi:MAG: polymer-forming cytoskeletal protein [Myxococcota bacterium]
MATIGESIRIKGDIEGSEDITIEGRIDGRVVLDEHHLTIGPSGNVHGEITGKLVSVLGTVVGDITADERIDVQNSGVINGDLSAPNLLIVEGAVINGAISMREKPALAAAQELEVGPGSASQQPSISSF